MPASRDGSHDVLANRQNRLAEPSLCIVGKLAGIITHYTRIRAHGSWHGPRA